MLCVDRSALICDLAETYQIYDYRSLPATMVATLAAGLRDDSRIKMKMSGVTASQDTILLAVIADMMNMYIYARSGGKGKPPESIADKFYIKREMKPKQRRFTSLEAFREAWNDKGGQ